jgi:uncharacterized protein with HEPN domain
MKSGSSRIPDFLLHILEATARIETYTRGMGDADFFANQLVQDAVIRNIEILGEAARNIDVIDPDFKLNHTELPLRDIAAMRNRLIHGYFSLDLEIIWKSVRQDIPVLHAVVKQVYDSLPK